MSNNSPSQAARRLRWAVVPALMALAGAAQAQNYDRYYDDGYNGGPVRCESIKNRTQQCALPGRARLVRQISGSPCVEGQTWGQARGGVWVTQGCRAEFVAEGGRGGGRWNGGGNGWGHNGGGNSGRGQILTCDSNDHRRQRCGLNRGPPHWGSAQEKHRGRVPLTRPRSFERSGSAQAPCAGTQ